MRRFTLLSFTLLILILCSCAIFIYDDPDASCDSDTLRVTITGSQPVFGLESKGE